jgi:hypothetical protein
MLDYYTSAPSVRTRTKPKEPKPNGSLFDSDFLLTEILMEPKNQTIQLVSEIKVEKIENNYHLKFKFINLSQESHLSG